MITSVRLIDFKNFADETLKLGPFTIIVGTNASGKSNIRDAFRILHGIGRGYTLAEIIGGKIGVGGQPEWEAIRGAPNAIARLIAPHSQSVSSFAIHAESQSETEKRFFTARIGVNQSNPDIFQMLEEKLNTKDSLGYESNPNFESTFWLTVGDDRKQLGISRSQPALTQLARGHVTYLPISGLGILSDMSEMRFLELEPNVMKLPSVPGATLGDFGQNLASVLNSICEVPESMETLAAWLRELTPMDVRGFRFPRDPYGNVYIEIVEANNRKITARSASDGTLRFLAMLAALLCEDPAKLYFFEEIDTGIHPARLSLLVDLIERQTKKRGFQVVTTTHSPELLAMVSDETFGHTSVVFRDEDSHNGIIRSVAELPDARKLRNSQGLDTLFAAGWLEDVLAFSESS